MERLEPEQTITIEDGEKNSSPRSWRNFLTEILQTILLALIFYFIIDSFFPRVRVENISMKPTLEPGELLLVNKLAYKLGSPQHGDVIVFHYPGNPEEDYIKRLIGLPGDLIKVENGSVFINGQEMEEPYVANSPAYQGSWEIPEDSFFVLGDNRNQSSDSHTWGFVPIKNVVGKALVVYWPINQIKILSHTLTVTAAQ